MPHKRPRVCRMATRLICGCAQSPEADVKHPRSDHPRRMRLHQHAFPRHHHLAVRWMGHTKGSSQFEAMKEKSVKHRQASCFQSLPLLQRMLASL